MNAKTPCPTWCETDHTRESAHARVLGEAEHTQVRLYTWATTDETAVQLTNLRPLRHDEPSITDIEPCEAPALAALMTSLGHPEIAQMVRDAVELVEQAEDAGR